MTEVTEYKGLKIVLTSGGKFRVAGESMEAASLPALKKKIDNIRNTTHVTLMKTVRWSSGPEPVTIVAPAKSQRASWKPLEWPTDTGRMAEGDFFELDTELAEELRQTWERHTNEKEALKKKHGSELSALTSRLVPVTSAEIYARLSGTPAQGQKGTDAHGDTD